MLFNSFSFLLFFPIVCVVYFLIPAKQIRVRNFFLLIASFYFYMNWKPAYALLLFTSILITYFAARGIERYVHNNVKKKFFLTGSLVLNIAILFLFKYYNFVASNITAFLHTTGCSINVPEFTLLLPVGISFYTFQAIGYTIDVYRGTIKAERDFATYALFVSFFPQLVAGPIERSYNMLPQFKTEHRFDYDRTMNGIRMMLWGFFLKLALADRCGVFVDMVYNNIGNHNGGSYLVASLMFPFQIYGDFAGYSLIAIGTANILGFRLMENFHRPYFAVTIGDFWHRWHISLSSWFKDYVYIPLGGNRVSKRRTYLNLLLTFAISGIWHGANWTFLCWGILHGIFLCIEKALNIHTVKYKGVRKLCHQALTFVLVSMAWVLFKSDNLQDALTIGTGIFTNFAMPAREFATYAAVAAAIGILAYKEIAEEYNFKINPAESRFWIVRHTYMVLMIAYIILFGVLGGDQFIYFQF